jgi:hypothetical protein
MRGPMSHRHLSGTGRSEPCRARDRTVRGASAMYGSAGGCGARWGSTVSVLRI